MEQHETDSSDLSPWWRNGAALAIIIGSFVLNLFNGGVAQLWHILNNGYWHARSAAFWAQPLARAIGWARLPADIIFIVFGAAPLVIATALAYFAVRKQPPQLIPAESGELSSSSAESVSS
jgi:nitric oxide reductase subunit B